MNVAGRMDFRRRLFNVYQINKPYPGMRTSAAIAAIAIVCGAIGAAPAARTWPAPAGSVGSSRQLDFKPQQHALQLAAEPATAPAPSAESDEDDKDVPTSQVDKYISVYEAMQKDHSLTVEQAASKQGLTVAQFRALENKIENDDTLRERVRKALRHTANPNDKESSDD